MKPKYRVITMPNQPTWPYALEVQEEPDWIWKTCTSLGVCGRFKTLDDADAALNQILDHETRGRRTVRVLDLDKTNPSIELCGSSPSS